MRSVCPSKLEAQRIDSEEKTTAIARQHASQVTQIGMDITALNQRMALGALLLPGMSELQPWTPALPGALLPDWCPGLASRETDAGGFLSPVTIDLLRGAGVELPPPTAPQGQQQPPQQQQYRELREKRPIAPVPASAAAGAAMAADHDTSNNTSASSLETSAMAAFRTSASVKPVEVDALAARRKAAMAAQKANVSAG
eukprot:SAG22_NODE_2589_length_2410_cov_1.832540_5_plen_198_part_01